MFTLFRLSDGNVLAEDIVLQLVPVAVVGPKCLYLLRHIVCQLRPLALRRRSCSIPARFGRSRLKQFCLSRQRAVRPLTSAARDGRSNLPQALLFF